MGDTGRYTCEALNLVGRSQKHYNLNVWGEGLPGWAGLGSLPLSLSELALKPRAEGGAALHGSQDTAFPRRTLPRGSLFHPSPQLPALLTSAPFFSVPPVFPSREPRILTVTEGHPARLSCDCRGVPFPKISWKKDGRLAEPQAHCPTRRGCPLPLLQTLAEMEMGAGAGYRSPRRPSSPFSASES